MPEVYYLLFCIDGSHNHYVFTFLHTALQFWLIDFKNVWGIFVGFEHDSTSVKMIELEEKLCDKLRGYYFLTSLK